MVKETKKTKKSKSEKETKVVKKQVSKKETKKEGIFKRIKNWFKSVRKELSNVTWPSKKIMVKYTVATLLFIVFFSLFFYLIEIAMAFFKSLV